VLKVSAAPGRRAVASEAAEAQEGQAATSAPGGGASAAAGAAEPAAPAPHPSSSAPADDRLSGAAPAEFEDAGKRGRGPVGVSGLSPPGSWPGTLADAHGIPGSSAAGAGATATRHFDSAGAAGHACGAEEPCLHPSRCKHAGDQGLDQGCACTAPACEARRRGPECAPSLAAPSLSCWQPAAPEAKGAAACVVRPQPGAHVAPLANGRAAGAEAAAARQRGQCAVM